MKIVAIANEAAWKELVENNNDIEWMRATDPATFPEYNDADGFFNLLNDASDQNYTKTQQPVFINSVPGTLKDMNAGKNIIRINGWNGFLKRNTWEAAGQLTELHTRILDALNKKIIILPDEPGFISARIISMIINEAFFAKEENVSTEDEINIAMKLGTNYPYGPFEWSEEIGITNVYQLLLKLSKIDNRYKPSSLLVQKAQSQ